jgi:FkbM family methyltransferase
MRNILRKARYTYRWLRNLHLSPTIKVPHEWYGNGYGGFYCCPVVLDDKSIVYSFGIGEDMSFDRDVMTRHGCEVFGFDPTPRSISWVGRQAFDPLYRFLPVGIGAKTGEARFFSPKNPQHVSGSVVDQRNVDTTSSITVPLMTLTDIASHLGHRHVDVVKLDIEGSEYEVIDSIIESDVPVGQLLVEFHDRFVRGGRGRSKMVVARLRSAGYEVFGVSPSREEVSFIKKHVLSVHA